MPWEPKTYSMYILASKHHAIYIGVTGALYQRLWQHKSKFFGGFTAKYNIDRHVYYEPYGNVRLAIAREKVLKRWRRARKIELIEKENPLWQDLSADWEDWCCGPIEAPRPDSPPADDLPGSRDSSPRAVDSQSPFDT